MLEYVQLQAEAAAAAAVLAALLAVILSAVFYGLQRRGISQIQKSLQPLSTMDPKIQYDVSRIDEQLRNTCADLATLRTGLPHTNELVTMREHMGQNVERLEQSMQRVEQGLQRTCEDFGDLRSRLDGEMASFRRTTADDMDKMRDDMMGSAKAKIIEHADSRLVEKSVSREEFDRLKGRVEKIVGSDEVAERMEVLASLFDSKQIKTINWQCKLVRLLNGGLAPDAEEDLLVSEGIPQSSYGKFLARLASLGIAEKKTISAFYMSPEYEWLYSYVDKPDWLQRRLEGMVKKEKEYQQYIGDNLHLVEAGLLPQNREYQLETGSIDFMCVDGSGRAVGLELKYPAATGSDKRQVSGYRRDYEKKTGASGARFVLVSPQIPDRLKEMLREDGLEYREIPMDG